jgi:hypothetical protein
MVKYRMKPIDKKGVKIMFMHILLIEIIFVGYIILKMINNKILKYILAPVISISYAAALFFVTLGIGGLLFLILVMMPPIFAFILIIRTIIVHNPADIYKKPSSVSDKILKFGTLTVFILMTMYLLFLVSAML